MDERWNEILGAMDVDKLPDGERARIAMNYFKKEIEPSMLEDKLSTDEQGRVKANFLNTLSKPVVKEGLYEGFVKPTIKAIPQAIGEMSEAVHGGVEAVTSLATGIPAAVAGAGTGLATLALTGGDVGAAKAVGEGVAEKLTYAPTTPMGKKLIEGISPIVSAPAEIGKETVQLPLESWKAPGYVAYPAEIAAEFGAYGPVAKIPKGVGLAKNILRDILVEKNLLPKRLPPSPEVPKAPGTYPTEQIMQDRGLLKKVEDWNAEGELKYGKKAVKKAPVLREEAPVILGQPKEGVVQDLTSPLREVKPGEVYPGGEVVLEPETGKAFVPEEAKPFEVTPREGEVVEPATNPAMELMSERGIGLTQEDVMKVKELSERAPATWGAEDKIAFKDIRERASAGEESPLMGVRETSKIGVSGKVQTPVELSTGRSVRLRRPPESAKIEVSGEVRKRFEVPIQEDSPRSVGDVVKDVNTALGEKGAVGGRELSSEQIAARDRLKQDVDGLRRKAQKAGKSIEEYLDSIGLSKEEIVDFMTAVKPFYSKLEDVVESKMGGRMSPEQLRKMLENNGVTQVEIKNVLVGLEEGKAVSKEQVLEESKAGRVELKDVVLGEPKKLVRNPTYGRSAGQREFITEAELRGEETYNAAGEPVEGNTQFSTYQEPGAIPGSYRESFTTAPNEKATSNKGISATDVFNAYEGKAASTGAWQDGHSAYSNIKNPVVRDRDNIRFKPDEKGRVIHVADMTPALIERIGLEEAKKLEGKKGWIYVFKEEMQGPAGDTKWEVTGLQGPKNVIKQYLDGMLTDEEATARGMTGRLNKDFTKRFDSKKAAEESAAKNGGTVEKVVEGEQGKMPPELQSRIYDIGVKRAIAEAKKLGVDGIAWTTGEMQANRYDLSKSIDSIKWDRLPSKGYKIDVTTKDGNQSIGLYASKDGIITDAHDSRLLGKPLEDAVGKEVAKQILEAPLSFGELKGLDLKVGGDWAYGLYGDAKGFKTDPSGKVLLSDKGKPLEATIAEKFKKYGKGEVETISINLPEDTFVEAEGLPSTYTKRKGGETKVSYLPITSKTPSSFSLYSGVDPTQIPKVLGELKGSVKDDWEKFKESQLNENLKRTGRGLKETVLEPEVMLRRTPERRAVWDTTLEADIANNVFVDRNYTEYIEAVGKIKQGSKDDLNVGRALNGEIPITDLTKSGQKLYGYLKEFFDTIIPEYARKAAGSEEAYQKVLSYVGRKIEPRSMLKDLDEGSLKMYQAIADEAAKVRGGKKVSELRGEARDQYEELRQQARDLLSNDFRKTLTEGELDAYNILSRRLDNYLPHLFDKREILDLFKTEFEGYEKSLNAALKDLETAKKKGDKKKIGTAQGMVTRLTNRHTELESLIKQVEGGGLVTFRQLPSKIFFRFFEKRKGAEGYSRSAMKAYETYLFGIARKMFDEPALKKVKNELFDKLDPEIKPYVQDYMDHFMGYDKHKLDWLANQIIIFEHLRTLGLSPRYVIMNATQRLNTIVSVGEKYSAVAEGKMLRDLTKKAGDKARGIEGVYETDEIFNKSGIAREVPNTLIEGEVPQSLKKAKAIIMYAGNKMELGNRKHAYLAGYFKALEEGGKKGLKGEELEAFAMKAGHKTVDATQFRYGRLGMPKLFWHPVGRVIFQFSSFLIKQARFLSDLFKADPKKFLKYIAYGEGVAYTAKEFFDTDLSNALGFGITWGEALKAIEDLAKLDTRGAWRHAKQTFQEGQGLIPSGPGPFVSSVYKVGAAAITENKGLQQLGKEVTPVMATRLNQFRKAVKNESGGEYPIYNTKGHVTAKLTKNQLLRRTFGPAVAEETEKFLTYEKKKNLKMEKKNVIESNVEALLDGGELEDLAMPSKQDVKNELLDRLFTPEEQRMMKKPGKAEQYELLREGRIY